MTERMKFHKAKEAKMKERRITRIQVLHKKTQHAYALQNEYRGFMGSANNAANDRWDLWKNRTKVETYC